MGVVRIGIWMEPLEMLGGDSSEDEEQLEFDASEGAENEPWSDSVGAPYVSRSIAEAKEVATDFKSQLGEAVALLKTYTEAAKDASEQSRVLHVFWTLNHCSGSADRGYRGHQIVPLSNPYRYCDRDEVPR